MPPLSRTPATPATSDLPGRHAAGEVPSDAALVSMVLLGDELSARRLRGRHEPLVGPLADRLGAPDGPELLSGAWSRLLDGIRLGSGLDVPVRVAWLSLVAQHATGSRAPRPWVGGDAAWTAYLSLPPAWQVVLWHAEVEGDSPEVLAALAGADQPSVERWTRVARGALRREVVRKHLPTLSDASCLRTATGMLGDLDASASPVELQQLHTHGLACSSCAELSADVLRVERDLGGVLARRVLGDDADWYLGHHVAAAPAAHAAPAAAPSVAAAVVAAVAADGPEEPEDARPPEEPEPDATTVVPVAATPRPAPRPAPAPRSARTTSRPAPPRRRGGSLLVGLAAAAVVAGILVGLRDDAPVEADLEAGGRDGRTAQAAAGDGTGSARTAVTGAAAPTTTATTAVDAPAPVTGPADRTAPDAPAATGPAAPGDPGAPATGDDGGTDDGGSGSGGGNGGGAAPEPPTTTPELPLRVSVDRDSGSATVELDPPLLGGNLSLTTPSLGGALGGSQPTRR